MLVIINTPHSRNRIFLYTEIGLIFFTRLEWRVQVRLVIFGLLNCFHNSVFSRYLRYIEVYLQAVYSVNTVTCHFVQFPEHIHLCIRADRQQEELLHRNCCMVHGADCFTSRQSLLWWRYSPPFMKPETSLFTKPITGALRYIWKLASRLRLSLVHSVFPL
jgi:hypothetical protein